MSDEDLRTNYKNSRQSINSGSTYRKNLNKNNDIHLIKIRNQTTSRSSKYKSLEDLNEKYNLNKNNEYYSLNKHKRWELSNILSENMPAYKEDNLDVKLYETVLLKNSRKSNNLIKIERSKGEKVNIKHKYANLASIKQKERLDQQEALNPAQPVEKKVNRFKMNSNNKQKNQSPQANRIIIHDETNNYDSNSDSDNSDNIEYEIEYDPKIDLVKDGQNGKMEKIDKISRKLECKIYNRYISYSDDETLKRSISLESDYETDYSHLDSNIEINLNDLIEKFSKVIINNKKKQKTKKSFNPTETNSKDNKKIYLDINQQVTYRKNNIYSNNSIYNYCEPIKLNLELNNKSIDTDLLKQIYGNKYNEAKECTPRRFNLNISEDIISVLESIHKKKLDLVVWLRFQESLQLKDTSFFNVSLCTNLINRESISIENINPCEIHDLDFVVLKSIEMFTKNLPIENFKLKEINSIQSKEVNDLYQNHVGRLPLPNICNQSEVKDLKEIKLEFINNFRESSSKKESINLNNNETKLECVLCFDENLSQSDCTILNRCSHVVCNECMKYYIDSRLANSLANSGKFPCPGNCNNNELELSLMINFASNANQLEIYLKLTVEKVWFVLKNYKWCPASNCSKILKIDLLSGFGTLSCICGYKTCLKCNNPPHFPAACKQIPNYYKELNKYQLNIPKNDEFYTSCGKKCPECHTFMEKNFGCNQMHCTVCSTTFCWNCLKTWEDHLKLNNGSHSCKEKEDKDFISVEFVSRKKNNADKKGYEDSVYHRQMRLSISTKNYSLLSEKLIKTIDFNGPIENSKENNTKRQEIRLFLTEIVSFLNELHFICEHGYVYLRDKTLSTDIRNKISFVIKKIEVIIWRINYILEFGSGLNAFNLIQTLYDQGIEAIKLLNEIKVKC